jgi:hypothetical protein
MKVIRVQLEMVYHVPDENIEMVSEFDTRFFTALEEDFNSWGDNPDEIRVPVNFEYRQHTGEVQGTDETPPMGTSDN